MISRPCRLASFPCLGALFVSVFLAADVELRAATLTAASVSLLDVTAAIASAVNGDTVIIPAGKASWTSNLVITKAITLMGQTTTDPVAGTAVNSTIIQAAFDNVPVITFRTSSTPSGQICRLTGITFQDVNTGTVNGGQPYISLTGSSSSVRIDHCNFALGSVVHFSPVITPVDSVYGVADHNIMVCPNGTCPFYVANGGDWPQGFISWAHPTHQGQSDFFFIEDNYIQIGGTFVRSAIDGTSGCKFVFRHNHCYNCLANGVHGTEGGNFRGARAMEIYNNDFHNPNPGNVGGARSGVILFHDNCWQTPTANTCGSTSTGPVSIVNPPSLGLTVYRALCLFDATGGTWFAADGTSPWDVNDGGGGIPVYGQAGHQYWPISGTATCGNTTPTQTQLTDSKTPGWNPQQWIGYGVTRTSDGRNSLISDNTSNTLTLFHSDIDGTATETLWASGDNYAIHRVLVALDQSGRGQGDPLTKNSSGLVVDQLTGTRRWPNQVLDPCYSWSNRQGTTQLGFNASPFDGSVTIQPNRDYFNEALPAGSPCPASCTQSTGVGVGTHAQRPANCKTGNDITGVTTTNPGTGYWETDTNTLFVCTGSTPNSSGTWTQWYQPYTYPHPLVTGVPSSGVLSPPTNLRIVP